MAGKRSEAQWREHLAHEDRERQLARDRHALVHHRAIVAMLVRARRQVARAQAPASLRAAQSRIATVDSAIEQHLAKINLWGNVSPLTAIYQDMLRALRDDLADRSGAPSGSSDAVARARLDWDARLTDIRDYLDEAARSEGEGE